MVHNGLVDGINSKNPKKNVLQEPFASGAFRASFGAGQVKNFITIPAPDPILSQLYCSAQQDPAIALDTEGFKHSPYRLSTKTTIERDGEAI